MNIWSRMPDSRLLVEVSLWSADFKRLADEIQRVDPYADMYHIDVSDGHFVPGFLFFADLVAALRPLTEKPFHVHLMTTQPQQHVADFVAAGADLISVHAENGPLAPAALAMARNAGLATGLVLGLDVLPQSVVPYLDLVDMVLMMGTPMGVKGVEPSRFATQRITQMQECIQQADLNHPVKVFADGGIRTHTVPELRKAGADGIIAGSLVFKSPNLQETVDWLHSLSK
ncbi:MAG: ribulose-phosphate 3-epimerase [Chloroflexi bacterium]|nr:ribulose-phosphate 3-epimerase [Chloroflexota bacterium]